MDTKELQANRWKPRPNEVNMKDIVNGSEVASKKAKK